MSFYKDKCEKSLSKEVFKNPPSEYRGAPFWSWNCKLNNELLEEQIDVFKKMGFGGFHIHSRTGMAEKYLGERFMNFVKFSVECAKKKDMRTYLYDEDRYSSGYAGGYVTKDPKYCSKSLHFTTNEIKSYPLKEAYECGKPYLVSVFDVCINDRGELLDYRQIGYEDECEGTKWYAYIVNAKPDPWFNNCAYVDTLNKEATDEFIKITYNSYRDAVGDEFGKFAPSMFTDEPHSPAIQMLEHSGENGVVVLPWTYSLPDEFQRKYGYDISQKIPEVVWNLTDNAISKARYDFHDFLCEMFVKNYLEKCQDACKDNNLKFTGHIMAEENLNSQTQWCGEAMRAYKYFDFPGVDILCHSIGLNTAKQCQSAVHQYAKEAMTCELYGVTNWNFDFRGHKLEGDWLAALGVTLRVPHLSWVSMAGESKRDYPAPIGYQSPWCEEYSYIENHFARVNTALTRGTPCVRVAVVHPIESMWINYGPNDSTYEKRIQLDQDFTNITEWLLFGTIDFDFICESLFSEQNVSYNNGKIKVENMQYEAVLVPNCETLRLTTLNRLNEFKRCGGTVIIAGENPKYIDAKSHNSDVVFDSFKHVRYNKYEILSALEPFRDVKLENFDGSMCDNLIYNMRRDNDCRWLFISHGKYPECSEDTSAQKIKIRIFGVVTPTLYNTLNGETENINYIYDGNSTVINYNIYQDDSILLKLMDKKQPSVYCDVSRDTIAYTLDFWGKVDYKLCEPNVLLLDRARFALNDEKFADEEEILRLDNICRAKKGWPLRSESFAQPWVVPEKEPNNFVTLKFNIISEIDVFGAMLAIEDAEKLDICLNGETVKNDVVGYYVDYAIKTVRLPKINIGVNELTVKIPFGQRTNIECCYILGNFGVNVSGTQCALTKLPEKIGFSDLTQQGMPFYGGNIVYKMQIDTPKCDMLIHTANYRGALVKVLVDGTECGISAFSPYAVRVENISDGGHIVELKLFGTRINTFGGLHNVTKPNWVNSSYWRTTGDNWSYEYMFWKNGILSAPRIEILKK